MESLRRLDVLRATLRAITPLEQYGTTNPSGLKTATTAKHGDHPPHRSSTYMILYTLSTQIHMYAPYLYRARAAYTILACTL
jgi:hypothetical protein